MQSLNPFIRAFFSSKLPSQCIPTHEYVLLAPTTSYLLTHFDQESQTPYSVYASSEEFLASHVLRAPTGIAPASSGKDSWSGREGRAKTRQYTTFNGRVVVIKDATVYSNRGFKKNNEAQILGDELYSPSEVGAQPWLIFFISKPLIGSENTAIELLHISGTNTVDSTKTKDTNTNSVASEKIDIKSFDQLLVKFPVIARQLQPGLQKLFKQFQQDLDTPPRSDSLSMPAFVASEAPQNTDGSRSPTLALSRTSTRDSNKNLPATPLVRFRHNAETLVLSAIEHFQRVDKQQLSTLGTLTDLSGPTIDKMIERYVFEHVHKPKLFLRICEANESEDVELQQAVKQMVDIDISQVGVENLEIETIRTELSKRVQNAVAVFKKMSVSTSPQEMVDILIETERCITSPASSQLDYRNEKSSLDAIPEVNADLLVATLLIVILRSSVRNLNARLMYMRDFNFMTDVESGEIGYTLSTFEAVLLYTSRNAPSLKKISRANRALWQAVRKGDIDKVESLLDPTNLSKETIEIQIDGDSLEDSSDAENENIKKAQAEDHNVRSPEAHSSSSAFDLDARNNDIYHPPEENAYTQEDLPAPEPVRPPLKKRVSMDTRSISSSSMRSMSSLTSTLRSMTLSVGEEISAEHLSKTRDLHGNSIIMMAIDSTQPQILQHLLHFTGMFKYEQFLKDSNDEGTNLLSAAVQGGNTNIISIVVNYLTLNSQENKTVNDYLRQQDIKGRSPAHYLFNAPHLIETLSSAIPWKLKDKNGQTPLFALFRSYDNEQYVKMVNMALNVASRQPYYEQELWLDDHIDGEGKSLLHVVKDAKLIKVLLQYQDSDPNARTKKHQFTPAMVASRYARLDAVRVFFNDPRTDLYARDYRGLSITELAKDDDIRNRIDDMILLNDLPVDDTRKTMIARSIFVEDGTVRLIIKSGVRSSSTSITVTTCRRSLIDFQNLTRWLALEHPASWIPSVQGLRSPFQLPSKPSRQTLRDIQLRLEGLLQALLSHTLFSQHEMVWEFILVPDIDPVMLAQRAQMKADLRAENLLEDYEPIEDDASIGEVEAFMNFISEQVNNVSKELKVVQQKAEALRNSALDRYEAQSLVSTSLNSNVNFLPEPYKTAFTRYAAALHPTEFSAPARFLYTVLNTSAAADAVLHALTRPTSLITSIHAARSELAKHHATASRTQRWPSAPFGLLDDAKARSQQDALDRARKSESELRRLGAELRYTQQTVASELAGWQVQHAQMLKAGIIKFAKSSLVQERERLAGMKRALRQIQLAKDDGASN